MQLVAGALCDRFGAARVFLAGAIALSAGSLAFPLAPTLGWLYAARAGVGLGASLIFLSVIKALDHLCSDEDFPRFMGISLFLGYAGGLFGTFPFERAVSAFGWRPSLFAIGLLCMAATAAGWFLIHGTPRLRPAVLPGGTLRCLGIVLRNPRNVPLLIVSPINFAIYFTVQATIGKKLLGDYLHVSPATAASLTFAMMLITMCTGAFGGFLTRWIGNRRKPLIVAAVLLVFVGELVLQGALAYGWRLRWFFVAYVLMACSSISATSGAALMKEYNPKEAVGIAVGLLNGMCYLAVALATTGVGLALDCFKADAVVVGGALQYPVQAYRLVFAVCTGFSIVAILTAVFFLRDSRGIPVRGPLAEE
jgi:MFS family permease